MRPSDIVQQLKILLPIYTGRFSETINVSSISVSGGTATIVASTPHDLLNGDAVTIANVEQRTPISSITKVGLIATITTSEDHDLTENWQENITLSGFSSSDWNASFPLASVPNRRTFTVRNTFPVPTLSGNEVLHENRIDGVNGQYEVTVVNTTTFTVQTTANDGQYFGGTVSGQVRVALSATIERAQAQYDEMAAGQLWGFIVPEDAEISKDRSTFSDAIATLPNGTDLRTRLIDPFSLYIFVPTDDQVAAEDALDICRHELLAPILKSLYGAKFESGLASVTDFKIVLAGHNIFGYTRAYYVHQFSWEAVYDLTDRDAVDNLATRAFRDLDYIQQHGGEDTTNLTASVNLDDDPITT